MANDILHYKGKPLVRSGKILFYGNPAEPYVARLQIVSQKDDDLKSADRVLVQILSTDETENPLERIVKKTEKGNLYEALSIAAIWLERILALPENS